MKACSISTYTGAVVSQRIGRYEIEGELGRGGFGLVYRARDPAMERFVAIKLLLSPGNPDAAARFRKEAVALARVPHRNIVAIHDVDEDAGRPFLVMEYLDGETLSTKIDSSSLSLAAKIEIVSQLAEGLHFAHSLGIVHRDIKPANVMVLSDGTVKIVDFGVARLTQATRVTQEGMWVGSLAYMAPEQFHGAEADALSDVFAYGILCYELITERHPFAAGDSRAVAYRIISEDPPPVSTMTPGCPLVLDAIISRTLAKSRDRRYQTLKEVWSDLQPLLRLAAGAATQTIVNTVTANAPATPAKRLRNQRQYQGDLRTHWLPKARGTEAGSFASYFTGRIQALREIVAWLGAENSGGKARIVIGRPGSGKSALLGRLVLLSDPACRSELLQSANAPADTVAPEGIIDVAIHARGKTLRDAVDLIAEQTGLTSVLQEHKGALSDDQAGELLADELVRSNRRWTILVDALDEAAEPRRIARGFLMHLSGRLNIWLTVGSRPDTHIDTATVEIDLDDELYFDLQDLAGYVERRLLAADDPSIPTPYRGQPELARRVATAVAGQSGRTFLMARIISRSLVYADTCVDTSSGDLHFPSSVGEAFEDYLDRFDRGGAHGLSKQKVVDLMVPLAWSEGRGLPWDEAWLKSARVLSGREYSNGDIEALLKAAGAYILEDTEDGIPVYRLYHEALAEHLRNEKRNREIQRVIAQALIDATPAAGEGKDWLAASAYARRHLAAHAAKAGIIDDLATDPLFLAAAEPASLHLILRTAKIQKARNAALVYTLAANRIRAVDPPERLSQLELIAKQNGLGDFADAINRVSVHRRWSTSWANWKVSSPHQVIANHAVQFSSLGAVFAIGRLDGRTVIVSGGPDGKVLVTDLDSGDLLYEVRRGQLLGISGMATGQIEGRPFIVAIGWNRLRVSDLRTGDVIGELAGSVPGSFLNVDVGPVLGRPTIASAAMDGTISLWDPITLKLLQMFRHDIENRAMMNSFLRISQSGSQRILSANSWVKTSPVVCGTDVRVWDSSTGRLLRQIPIPLPQGQWCFPAAFIDDRGLVAYGDTTGCVQLHDLNTWDRVGELPMGHQGPISALTTGEMDGCRVVVSAGEDETIRIWNLDRDSPLPSLMGSGDWIQSLAVATRVGQPVIISAEITFSADRRGNSLIRVWEVPVPRSVAVTSMTDSVLPDAPLFEDLAICAIHARTVVVGLTSQAATILNAETGDQIGDPISVDRHFGRVVAEVNGAPILVTTDGHSIKTWNLAERNPVGQHLDEGFFLNLCYLSGRTVVAVGGRNRDFRFWDLASREAARPPVIFSTIGVSKLHQQAADVVSVLVFEDGARNLFVWDVISESEPDAGPQEIGYTAEFDGSISDVMTGTMQGHPWLAVARETGISVFDLRNFEFLTGFRVHSGALRLATGTLNGRVAILHGGNDMILRVHDLTSSTEVAAIHFSAPIKSIHSLAPRDFVVQTSMGLARIRLAEGR